MTVFILEVAFAASFLCQKAVKTEALFLPFNNGILRVNRFVLLNISQSYILLVIIPRQEFKVEIK